jgi:hypothetical protein
LSVECKVAFTDAVLKITYKDGEIVVMTRDKADPGDGLGLPDYMNCFSLKYDIG